MMDNDTSNTGQNRKPGTFRRGDPRINRKGRPRSFDALRELAQQIAHETAQAGGVDVVINGHKVTVAEAILRTWAQSKNPQLVRAFIEIAYGKVPDNINITGNVPIIIKGVDYRTAIANLAPGSMEDSEASGEGKNTFDGSSVG